MSVDFCLIQFLDWPDLLKTAYTSPKLNMEDALEQK